MSVSVNRNMPKSARPQFRANGGGGGGAATLSLDATMTTWLDVFKRGTNTIQSLTIPANGFGYLKYFIDLRKLANKLGYDGNSVVNVTRRRRYPDAFGITSINPHAEYNTGMMGVGWYVGSYRGGILIDTVAVATVRFVNPTGSALTIKPYLDNPSNYKQFAIAINTQLLTTDPTAYSQPLQYVNPNVAQGGVEFNISDLLYA